MAISSPDPIHHVTSFGITWYVDCTPTLRWQYSHPIKKHDFIQREPKLLLARIKTVVMLIGIIADTHDRLDLIGEALSMFKEKNVATVLHAGDFISPFVIPLFAGLQVYGVFGNNDGEKKGLRNKFSEIESTVTDYFCEVTLDFCNIAVTHGHIPELLALLMKSGLYDVVVTGHTHEPEIRKGAPIMINPGECCGYLSDRSTIAVFDTKEMKGEILEIH